jgi:hypothetical protein
MAASQIMSELTIFQLEEKFENAKKLQVSFPSIFILVCYGCKLAFLHVIA